MVESMIASSRARLRQLPASHPLRPRILHDLAASLAARSQGRSNPADLEEAIHILRKLLSKTPVRHPSRASILYDLASMLFESFYQDKDGRFHDLEESIALYQDALKLRPPLHPRRSELLLRLATALSSYLKLKGVTLDPRKHIEICREALDLHLPSHPDYCPLLSDLASVLYTRFEKEKTFEDLEESIKLFRRLIDMDPSGPLPGRAASLHNLANALSSRSEQRNNQEDLEEAIILYRKALSIWPDPHPDRSKYLTNLGLALCNRSFNNIDCQDLEDAITMFWEVLSLQPSPHQSRFSSLNNLAKALYDRSGRTGDLQDIEDSIALNRQALMLRPAPHPDASSTMVNLGKALLKRFEQRGDFRDLEESILLPRDALTLQRSNHSDCSLSLSSLGCALYVRFKHKRDVQDIEDSISLQSEALALTPVSRASHATILGHLGTAILARFEDRGTFQDLEDVIVLYRKGLQIHPISHVTRVSLLSNLAIALWNRFEQKRLSADIEESILLYHEALRLRPKPHADRNDTLGNLACALISRCRYKGDLSDLEEGITLYKEALSTLPHDHCDYPWFLRELASALAERFRLRNSTLDLHESISLYERLLSLEPVSYPTRGTTFLNLAVSLRERFECYGNFKDIEDALEYCEKAAKYEAGLIFLRFDASMVWASYAGEFRPTSAPEAYSYAITLLPFLASVDLTLQQRQDVLRHARRLVWDAVKSAINSRQYGEAVVFLSTGRSVFWSQALQLRTSVEGLAISHPTLAEEYTTTSRQLEKASYSGRSSVFDSSAHRQFNAETRTGLSHLADRRSMILEEIRQIPGFERFLFPPSFLSLQDAADNGPLILLNASQFGCDALILRKKSVEVVPLLLIDLSMLDVLQSLFDMARDADTEAAKPAQDGTPSFVKQPARDMTRDPNSENSSRNIPETDHKPSWARVVRKAADGLGIETEGLLGRDMTRASNSAKLKQEEFRFALHCLWIRVVQPIVKGLKLKKTDVPARIWWCPTGLFTSFPIHAAGVYSDDDQPIDCLFEYAVSSYCTSPQDLLHPPPPVKSGSGYKITAVIEPDVPGSQPLPATRKELKEIEKHAHQSLVTHVGSKEAPTQVENLLSDIQQSSIVHFGCHGLQDLDNPLESYLLLSGGKLTMSRIMKECRVPEGALAYLSACETAKGDGVRPDESLNLVATMMFAGFRGVVGTMWSIFDDDTPIVADVFYGYLFRNGKKAYPDVRDAAFALHLATKELRDRGKPFQSWIPYVHYGI